MPRRGDQQAIENAARTLGVWPVHTELDWYAAHDLVVKEIHRRHRRCTADFRTVSTRYLARPARCDLPAVSRTSQAPTTARRSCRIFSQAPASQQLSAPSGVGPLCGIHFAAAQPLVAGSLTLLGTLRVGFLLGEQSRVEHIAFRERGGFALGFRGTGRGGGRRAHMRQSTRAPSQRTAVDTLSCVSWSYSLK